MKKPLVPILLLLILATSILLGLYIKHQHTVKVEMARLAEQARLEQARIAEQKRLHDEYAAGFRRVVADLDFQSEVAYLICNKIASYWEVGTGIENTMTYFIYVAQNKLTEAGLYNLLKTGKRDLEDKIRNLANPPEDYKIGYDQLIEMYGSYAQLYNQAVTPAGSYVSYCKDMNDKHSEIQKAFNKILVVVPDAKGEFDKKAQDLEAIKKKLV